MAYLEQLESGLRRVVQAGEAGRRSLDGVMGPVNGAISDIRGAADELTSLPFLPDGVGEKVQRLTRGISAAQARVSQVVNTYNAATRALAGIDERISTLKEQATRAATAANKLLGKVSPKLANVIPSGLLAPEMTPSPEVAKPYPHLMILQPLTPSSQPYYFNLDTAAFDELRRQSEYRWAAQERLSRRPAQQAVGIGAEKLSLKGAIFPAFKGGLGQLEALRTIAKRQEPLNLTTGYGEVLGTWCLASIDEEQTALVMGGAPLKQGFTLEFVRYGDDMQNL